MHVRKHVLHGAAAQQTASKQELLIKIDKKRRFFSISTEMFWQNQNEFCYIATSLAINTCDRMFIRTAFSPYKPLLNHE